MHNCLTKCNKMNRVSLLRNNSDNSPTLRESRRIRCYSSHYQFHSEQDCV
ncbi:tetracycline resistance efflux system leader peptide [uncultured Marinobacter sp.]